MRPFPLQLHHAQTLIFTMANSSTSFARSILFFPVKMLFIYWLNMFSKLSNTFSNYLISTHLIPSLLVILGARISDYS